MRGARTGSGSCWRSRRLVTFTAPATFRFLGGITCDHEPIDEVRLGHVADFTHVARAATRAGGSVTRWRGMSRGSPGEGRATVVRGRPECRASGPRGGRGEEAHLRLAHEGERRVMSAISDGSSLTRALEGFRRKRRSIARLPMRELFRSVWSNERVGVRRSSRVR